MTEHENKRRIIENGIVRQYTDPQPKKETMNNWNVDELVFRVIYRKENVNTLKEEMKEAGLSEEEIHDLSSRVALGVIQEATKLLSNPATNRSNSLTMDSTRQISRPQSSQSTQNSSARPKIATLETPRTEAKPHASSLAPRQEPSIEIFTGEGHTLAKSNEIADDILSLEPIPIELQSDQEVKCLKIRTLNGNNVIVQFNDCHTVLDLYKHLKTISSENSRLVYMSNTLNNMNATLSELGLGGVTLREIN